MGPAASSFVASCRSHQTSIVVCATLNWQLLSSLLLAPFELKPSRAQPSWVTIKSTSNKQMAGRKLQARKSRRRSRLANASWWDRAIREMVQLEQGLAPSRFVEGLHRISYSDFETCLRRIHSFGSLNSLLSLPFDVVIKFVFKALRFVSLLMLLGALSGAIVASELRLAAN